MKIVKALSVILGVAIMVCVYGIILQLWADLFGWKWVGKVALECAAGAIVMGIALGLICFGRSKQ